MRKYSKTEQVTYLKNWATSGLTKKAYCQREGINYGTFFSWQSRQQKAQEKPQGKFIALPNQSRQRSSEVLFPNGLRLVLGEPLSVDLLKRLKDV